MPDNYDVAIVGGGMVGATLACALGGSRLKVAVIETREPPPFDPDSHDLRVSAVTRASEQVFQMLGAWQSMRARRVCPFREMLVWDGEGKGQTHFDCTTMAEPTLGHIVENGVIQLALLERLRDFDNIDWICPAAAEILDLDDSRLVLADGRVLRARLIVAADGARSKVRELAGIISHSADYDQHALVSTVQTHLPQQSITWQRHMASGPQAFLPLTGHRASLVWYNSPEEVKRLQALDDEGFIVELARSFAPRLGAVTAVLGRGSFPICRSRVENYILPGLALVGDAAHVIHPHLGQGVNLGVLDAATLAEVIIDAHHAGKNFAGRPTLRRYERWRKANNLSLLAFSDGVFRAFANQQLPVRIGRAALLNAADKVQPLNHLCMRYAMGLIGDLPRLAKGRPLNGGDGGRPRSGEYFTPRSSGYG